MIIEMSNFDFDGDELQEDIDTSEDLSGESHERLAYALKAAGEEHDQFYDGVRGMLATAGFTFSTDFELSIASRAISDPAYAEMQQEFDDEQAERTRAGKKPRLPHVAWQMMSGLQIMNLIGQALTHLDAHEIRDVITDNVTDPDDLRALIAQLHANVE